MKVALIIIGFVLVTLGPLAALWLRASFDKKPPASRPVPPESRQDDD